MEELHTVMSQEIVGEMRMNPLQKIWNIIISPSKAMEAIIQKPGILFPLILMAAIPFALTMLRWPLFENEMFETAKNALQANPKLSQMTADQLDQLTRNSISFAKWATLINMPIMWFVQSVIIFIIMKILKGEGKFKQILSVMGYSTVILLLANILATLVSYQTNSLMLDTTLTLVTNMLNLDIKGSYIYGVIRGVNIFTIWQYCVIAIGLHQLTKLSKAKINSTMGAIFIIGLLIFANSLKIL
jgi:hypothetical protein